MKPCLTSASRSRLMKPCRLNQGRLNKARRGELFCHWPIYPTAATTHSSASASYSHLRVILGAPRTDTEREKRAMQPVWTKREKQIDRMLTNAEEKGVRSTRIIV